MGGGESVNSRRKGEGGGGREGFTRGVDDEQLESVRSLFNRRRLDSDVLRKGQRGMGHGLSASRA